MPNETCAPDTTITLAHGAGGRKTAALIHDIFAKHFHSPYLTADDAAVLPIETSRIAITTDGFIVSPWRFPGGNIGKLSICGTVNDLACMGARPRYLTCAFQIEEGFPIESLDTIAKSMAETAEKAGVHLVAGDTKVAGKGQVDHLFITTTGVGEMTPGVKTGGALAQPGDDILVTGDIGRHGAAILLARGDYGIDADIKSDCAPLAKPLLHLLETLPVSSAPLSEDGHAAISSPSAPLSEDRHAAISSPSAPFSEGRHAAISSPSAPFSEDRHAAISSPSAPLPEGGGPEGRGEAPARPDTSHGLPSAGATDSPTRADIHTIRDATRGGVGTVLHEIAAESNIGIDIDETALPVHPAVRGLTGLLGLTPLYLACEGRAVILCRPSATPHILQTLQKHPDTQGTTKIGVVTQDHPSRVTLTTQLGTQILLPEPTGELLPRIC